MIDWSTTSQVLGTAFFTIVVFTVGAIVGPRFFGWLTSLLPWNKSKETTID